MSQGTTSDAARAAGSEDNGAKLEVGIHGPNVTLDDAIEVAQATKTLLGAVASHLGAPEGSPQWVVTSIQFKCDGCDLRVTGRPGPDEGWTYADGDDFCPDCTAHRAQTGSDEHSGTPAAIGGLQEVSVSPSKQTAS